MGPLCLEGVDADYYLVSARKLMFFTCACKKAASARLAMAEKQEFTFRK